MTKMTSVVLGLSLIVLGIIGITNFSLDMQYVYIGEIALGIVGLLIGIYARQGVSDQRLKTEIATQKKDIEHQKKEIDQQKKMIDAQNNEIEEHKKQIEIQRNEIEEQRNKVKELGSSV